MTQDINANANAEAAADAEATAVKLKNEGNKALLSNNYHAAIALYSQAIELDSFKEVYFANRAQAYIKEEMYGAALEDASQAIVLNPAYTKAYYRRAVAQAAILRYKDAMKDFRTVVERAPADKDARVRLDECAKIVRAKAFAKAIAVENAPAIADSLDIKSMVVDKAYDGAKLDISFEEPTAAKGGDATKPTTEDDDDDKKKLNKNLSVVVTKEFVLDMISRFRTGKLLDRKYVFAIVLQAMKIFEKEATMVEVDIPEAQPKDNFITVCGDTHGQLFDLLNIFEVNGYPSETHMYLFNGDFVDRGSWSTEIALLLYAYKILYPSSLFINRGNHESDDMNKMYGFEGECKAKYKSDKVFGLFSESFSALPLATLIAKQYLVLHGGLFSDDSVSLHDIRKYNRFSQRQPGTSGLMMEMLWTDPQPTPGRKPSKRGVGLQFGPDVTAKFCEANGLRAIIRSHEVRMGGYELEHDGKLVTVFSAPNYCDSQGNMGAYINIRAPTYEMEFNTFEAVQHPDIKPMAYASKLMH